MRTTIDPLGAVPVYGYGWHSVAKLPVTTKLTELHSPDRAPSSSRIEVAVAVKGVVTALEIKADYGQRIGAIVVSAHGISLFTEEEIRSRR